jgi:hypothetical protein
MKEFTSIPQTTSVLPYRFSTKHKSGASRARPDISSAGVEPLLSSIRFRSVSSALVSSVLSIRMHNAEVRFVEGLIPSTVSGQIGTDARWYKICGSQEFKGAQTETVLSTSTVNSTLSMSL